MKNKNLLKIADTSFKKKLRSVDKQKERLYGINLLQYFHITKKSLLFHCIFVAVTISKMILVT